jgi:hypothetical protein
MNHKHIPLYHATNVVAWVLKLWDKMLQYLEKAVGYKLLWYLGNYYA